MDSEFDTLNVGFIPEFLPDELLYSFLGRIVALNALGTSKKCIQNFFGSNNVIPSPDLPTRLRYLHDRLGIYSPVTSSNELVELGTLYPYHRPFIHPERDLAATQLLLHGDGKGLKALLGRLANRFGANVDLRSCAVCLREDIVAYGTIYWHRSHQLPGVTACHKHETCLLTRRKRDTADEKQCFLLPSCEEGLQSCPAKATTHQIAFSALSEALLNERLPALDPAMRTYAYKEAMHRLGLCKNGRVQYAGLAVVLREHYSDFNDFLYRKRLLSTEKTPLAWIRPLIERPDRACHPICHLILIDFLFGSLRCFLTALKTAGIEEPPSVANSIRDEARADIDHEAMYRNTCLSCRSVARLTGMSVSSVVSKRRALGVKISDRRKHINEDRLTKIVRLLTDRLSVGEVASLCEVSVSTVYRVRRENARTICAALAASGEPERERDKRRFQWLTAAETHSDAGVNAVRSAAPAAYAWLRRHDRDWLQKSCAQFPNYRLKAPYVDWPRRDRELCAQMEKFAAELRLRSKRPRVSRSLLTRIIGEASFRSNEYRLPGLKDLIDSLEESPFSYELRRLDMAVQELYLAGKQLSLWRIQRAAGIRSWTKTHAVYVRWKTKRYEHLRVCAHIDDIP